MNYQVEPIPRHLLDDTLNNYVCSICWGPLDFHYDTQERKWYALCRRHKEDTIGYTSKNYADRRRAESESEAIEAAYNLREILGLAEPISQERALKDLGF